MKLRKLIVKDIPGMMEWMQDVDISRQFRADFSHYTEDKIKHFIDQAHGKCAHTNALTPTAITAATVRSSLNIHASEHLPEDAAQRILLRPPACQVPRLKMHFLCLPPRSTGARNAALSESWCPNVFAPAVEEFP